MTRPSDNWITSAKAADLLQVSNFHVRRLAGKGQLVSRRTKAGFNGNALEIFIQSLPPHHQALLLSQLSPESSRASYDSASDELRERADRRLIAVADFDRRMKAAGRSARKADLHRSWLAAFRKVHPSLKVSVASVRRWSQAYRERGLDGLVDGNDGSARRGKFSIPEKALRFFLAEYLDENCRSISKAIRETRMFSRENGIEIPRADHPFYRYARTIETLRRSSMRENADNPSAFLPHVERDYDSLPALHTIQSDHHQADVGVRCESEECKKAHFPWWTVFIDVRSRKILSWSLAIDAPNSSKIRDAFRLAVEEHGLPHRVYIDNGKDYKKAFGKSFWRDKLTGERIVSDQGNDYFKNLLLPLDVTALFATPYHAQAKVIERMFRSFVERWWKGFDAYRGALGRRTERAADLHKNVRNLPSLSLFAQELEMAIAIYNDEPHRGRGMDGKSPNAVFHAKRITVRQPERLGWALQFWSREERKVGRSGLRFGNLTYWLLDDQAHYRHQGETVQVLIDPKDARRVIVCDLAGSYICDAEMQGLSPQIGDDPITADHLRRVKERSKFIRRQNREGDFRHSLEYQLFRSRRPAVLQRMAAEARAREEQLAVPASAVGTPAELIIPRYSQLARDRKQAVIDLELSTGLSAADRHLAASIPDITDERLDDLLRTHPTGPRLIGSGKPEELSEEDERFMRRERRRIALERKRDLGLCEVDECRVEVTRSVEQEEEQLCAEHWWEINGAHEPVPVQAALRELLWPK